MEGRKPGRPWVYTADVSRDLQYVRALFHRPKHAYEMLGLEALGVGWVAFYQRWWRQGRATEGQKNAMSFLLAELPDAVASWFLMDPPPPTLTFSEFALTQARYYLREDSQ